mgnify:CR=1 FL=1
MTTDFVVYGDSPRRLNQSSKRIFVVKVLWHGCMAAVQGGPFLLVSLVRLVGLIERMVC